MTITTKEAGKEVTNPKDVARILRAILRTEETVDQDKEHCWVIGLTTRNTVKYIELVSLGTLNANLVHPREVFRTAITQGVAGIILGHNHPSGDPTNSEDDLTVTKTLIEAGKIISIPVLDHVIIGNKRNYLSLKESCLKLWIK